MTDHELHDRSSTEDELRDQSAEDEEAARLARLDELGLLELGQLPELQRLTRVASRLLRVPVTLASFVGRDRQVFKGRTGTLPARFADATPISHSFCRHVVDSGRPLVVEDARHDARVLGNLGIEGLGIAAYAGSPIVDPDGRVLGSLCAIDREPREWTAEELETLDSLAEIASSEIALRIASQRAQRVLWDTEMALLREQRLGEMLQRSLRPRLDLSRTDVRVGSLYRPASGLIGGDFLDTFPLGPDRVGLVVGDIVGKGPVPATRALELRGELRRLALADPRPACVLSGLNALAASIDEMRGTSLVYAVIDCARETVTWITAGHAPPLCRHESGEGASFLEVSGGMLLGLHPLERAWEERQRPFPRGSTLVLFTDGLLEAPGADIVAREELLRAYVASGPEDPRALCDGVFDAVPDPGARDDVAVLALRLDR